jgi:glucosyl-3-phosphoglycerate synthase
MHAGEEFLERPMDKAFIPSGNRVISAIPDIIKQLKHAVEQDNQEYNDS